MLCSDGDEPAARNAFAAHIRQRRNQHNAPGGSMICVSKEIAVNRDTDQRHPKLSRSEIWKGLVLKADNALPFVPGMAKCDVIERAANGLVRDIVFRGEGAREKVTFYPEEKVVFLRLSGNADG